MISSLSSVTFIPTVCFPPRVTAAVTDPGHPRPHGSFVPARRSASPSSQLFLLLADVKYRGRGENPWPRGVCVSNCPLPCRSCNLLNLSQRNERGCRMTWLYSRALSFCSLAGTSFLPVTPFPLVPSSWQSPKNSNRDIEMAFY